MSMSIEKSIVLVADLCAAIWVGKRLHMSGVMMMSVLILLKNDNWAYFIDVETCAFIDDTCVLLRRKSRGNTKGGR